MRRATLLALAATAATMLLGGTGVARSGPPARLLVYAQEWSLWPSRTTVPGGELTVTLWNRGQDPHDLRVRPLGHGRAALGATTARGIAPAAAGAVTTASWRLPPGRYLLFCALPEHERLGMHAGITVR